MCARDVASPREQGGLAGDVGGQYNKVLDKEMVFLGAWQTNLLWDTSGSRDPVLQQRNASIFVAQMKLNELCDELWSRPERSFDTDRLEYVLFAVEMEIIKDTSTC